MRCIPLSTPPFDALMLPRMKDEIPSLRSALFSQTATTREWKQRPREKPQSAMASQAPYAQDHTARSFNSLSIGRKTLTNAFNVSAIQAFFSSSFANDVQGRSRPNTMPCFSERANDPSGS